MRQIRLGLAQLNPTVGDLVGNAHLVAETIGKARALGVDVLAFPEMVITGYPPEDLLLKPSFIERAIEVTRGLEPLTVGMTIVVGTVERDYDLYNAAAVIHDGHWVGTYRKRYLPNYGVFDENRYFMPTPAIRCSCAAARCSASTSARTSGTRAVRSRSRCCAGAPRS